MLGVRCFATLLLGIAAARPAAAQQEIVVSDGPVCVACRVTLRRSVVLGDTDGAGALTGNGLYSITARPNGSVVLISRGDLPAFYRPDGSFERYLGAKGEGPGELNRPFATHFEGDSIIRVLDAGQSRQSWFRANGSYIRSEPFLAGPARRTALTRAGTVVVAATLSAPATAGFPLHRIGSDGRVIQSFGRQYAVNNRMVPADYRMRFTVAPNGGLVTVHELDYRIQLLSEQGVLVKEFRRDAPWFRRRDVYRGASLANPPDPYVQDLFVDSEMRAWILITRGGANWRDGLGKTVRDASGQECQPVEDEQVVYRSVLEVVDLRVGRLLVRSELPGYFHHLVSDQVIAQLAESENGRPVVRLWSIAATFVP